MKQRKWLFKVTLGGIIILAGIADLKYKGKLYQTLPASIQDYVDTYVK